MKINFPVILLNEGYYLCLFININYKLLHQQKMELLPKLNSLCKVLTL